MILRQFSCVAVSGTWWGGKSGQRPIWLWLYERVSVLISFHLQLTWEIASESGFFCVTFSHIRHVRIPLHAHDFESLSILTWLREKIANQWKCRTRSGGVCRLRFPLIRRFTHAVLLVCALCFVNGDRVDRIPQSLTLSWQISSRDCAIDGISPSWNHECLAETLERLTGLETPLWLK